MNYNRCSFSHLSPPGKLDHDIYCARAHKTGFSRKKNTGRASIDMSSDTDKNQDIKIDLSNRITKEAIEYLRLYNERPREWKFKKRMQVHLMKIMYDKALLSKSEFGNLLTYLSGIQGKAKERLIDDASKIIAEKRSSKSENDGGSEEKKLRTKRKRAKKILKCFKK